MELGTIWVEYQLNFGMFIEDLGIRKDLEENSVGSNKFYL